MNSDGGAAFPVFKSWMNERKGYMEYESAEGMSLRDYFAAAAIDRAIEVSAQFVMDADDFEPGTVGLSEIVRRGSIMAFAVADAMLKERDR